MRFLRWFGLGLVCTSAAAAWSCSAGGGSQLGQDATSGNSAGAGASGAGSSGIGGGFVQPDAGDGDALSENVCSAVAEEAKPKLQPADIIFAVDTSGSMSEENCFIRESINAFSQQIIDSGIDVHVIMLAEPPIQIFGDLFDCSGGGIFGGAMSIPGICVAPPLGSGQCPDDSLPPQYVHLGNSAIASTDGLNRIYDLYPQYKANLRPDATKSIVVVTDDNATSEPYNDAATFITDYTALDPVLLADFKMNGIYCKTTCGDCASQGSVWEAAIDQTGGLHGELCNQEFQPIFDALAEQIIVGAAELPCQWNIPAPPEGEALNPELVNVVFTDGAGTKTTLGKVDSASACDASDGGWYYNDGQNPTTVHLCPASCDTVKADPAGKIDILFGCATEVLVPN